MPLSPQQQQPCCQSLSAWCTSPTTLLPALRVVPHKLATARCCYPKHAAAEYNCDAAASSLSAVAAAPAALVPQLVVVKTGTAADSRSSSVRTQREEQEWQHHSAELRALQQSNHNGGHRHQQQRGQRQPGLLLQWEPPQQQQQQQHQTPGVPCSTAQRHGAATQADAARDSTVTVRQHSTRGGSGSSSSQSSSNCRDRVPLERYISSCIKQCSSWQQVDAVVREYGPAFNIIHISAAITHLAQLAQRAGTTAGSAHHQQQQQQQVVPQLSHVAPSPNEQQVLGLGLITRQMEHTHAHLQAQLQLQTPPAAPGSSHGNGNSSNGHVPAALPSQADDQVLQQQLVGVLLSKAMSRLHEARSRQVANMLWALAVLQQQHLTADRHTTAQAAGVLLAHAAELFSASEPQHLSNMALAAAKLQLPVTQGWLQQLTDAWLQCGLQGPGRSGAGQGGSQAHSSLVDSIVDSSVGSQGPSSSSLRVHSSTQQVDSSSASVQFGVESVQQGVLTGSGAAEQAAHAAAAACAAINPQATCNLLWALVQLLQQQQQQQSEQVPWLQEWLQVMVAAAAPQLATWPAKSVSMFLWACARLGYGLHSSTQQATAGFSTRQQQQQQQQTHGVGAGAAPGNDAVLDGGQAVNRQQDSVVVQGLLLALRQHTAAFSSRDLSQALWGAAVLKLPVPGDLLQLLLSASSHQQQLSGRAAAPSKQHAQHQQPAVSTAAAAGAGSAAVSSQGSGASYMQQQQQQQQQQPGLDASRELAHSVSMVLWSLGRLAGGGAAQQLPRPVLQPWLSGLAASAAAASGQSLGVAAWAAGQLGLTASCPQLVLHLVQAAAHRQQLTAQQQQQQQQQPQMTADISHVTSSMRSSQPGHAAAGSALPAEAVAAVVWCAARCVVQLHLQQQNQPAQVTSRAQPQQQQQQQQVIRRQRAPGPFGASDVHAGTSVSTAAAAGRVWGRSQAPPASADKRCQHTAAVQAAVSVLLMHWSGTHSGLPARRTPQLPLWQFALVLWSASVMQLQLPARWWHDQLQHLQHLLQQSKPHGLQHQQQQQQDQQQQGMHQCHEHAQALAAAVWALGRSRVAVPRAHVEQLQDHSLAFLQDPQQRALSEEGSVLLLLGFTRVVTTAAARLPAKTPLQQRQQHKRQRLLRRRLQRQRQRQRHSHHTQQRKQSLPRQQVVHHEELLHKPTSMQQQQHSHQQAASQLHQHSVVRLESPPAQQQQQQPVQQRGRSHRLQRRRLWWQQHLQQQRVRVAWQRWIWQRQRHGWVSASGLRSEWLRAYCAYSHPLVAAMGRDSVVSVLWALGRLRFHPGSSFVAAALSRAQQLLPVMQARHIALLLWSLARLQVVPEGPVLDQLMHAWEMQLAYASVVDTQQVGWAHKQLQRLQALQGR